MVELNLTPEQVAREYDDSRAQSSESLETTSGHRTLALWVLQAIS